MIIQDSLFIRVLRRLFAPRAAMATRTAMHVEEIEPRILHSADLAPFALTDLSGQGEIRVIDAVERSVAQSMSVEQPRTRELVVVDASTAGFEQLVADLESQAAAGRDLEIVLIQPGADGIRQITDALSGADRITAIHFISHGGDGAIRLGASTLDYAALEARAAEIGSWSRALSADADLLIYGCDVAATPEGRQFVDALAHLTGADVAASEDLTGNSAAGGDWSLEYRVGAINAPLAPSLAVQQAWQGTLANNAPVLSGPSNNFPVMNEDPSANNGLKVSELIAGMVTDADPTPLSGIAVTAVDDTNGTWEYTTNGGGGWTAFGAVSESAARLLTDAANTSVRFVPDANWHGTVAGGITFRAWDQTSGVAGGVAAVGDAAYTVRDNFSAVAYTNNNGTESWSMGWLDSEDANAGGGAISVTGNALRLQTFIGSAMIEREVDLSRATSAIFSFSYNNGLNALLGNVVVSVSNNGGASYTTLTSAIAAGSGSLNFDIGAYIASNTRIRFQMDGVIAGGTFTADDIEIAYVRPLNGGTTAFSAATASASVTVTSVNDRPIGTDATIVMTEGASFVFTTASFGFTDPRDTPANALLNVRINTLPVSGALTLNGIAVTAGQSISALDIVAGKLRYTPAVNGAGAGYATLAFKVQDDGGGADTDTTNRTLTFNVTPVNDAPVGTTSTVTAIENTTFVFSAATFGFTDPGDTPANNFAAVQITALTGAGSLKLNGVAVSGTQSVSLAQITAGDLVFDAAPGTSGAGYASFTFQVQDDGGTQGGGVDLDPVARTLTIDVVEAYDAPLAAVPIEIVAMPVVTAQQDTVQTSAASAAWASASAVTAMASAVPAATAAAAAEAGDAPSGEATAAAHVVGAEAPATGATGGTASSTQFVQVGVQRQDAQQPAREFRGPSLVAVQETQVVAPNRIDAGGSVSLAASAFQSATVVSSAAAAAMESHAMLQELDQMREGLREHTKFEANVTAASAAAGMSVSVGYVVWMLRGGVLVSALLSSIPAWRLVDPLPVLGHMDDDGDEDGDDADDSLESLVARNNAASDEPAAGPHSPAQRAPA